MKRSFSGILIICLVLAQSLAAATPATEMKKSVVRITMTEQEPNYKVPWAPGSTASGVGAGFVIETHNGQRVMTNAHVVSNSRFLSVSKENDPKQYIAHVEFVGHDCDLAVLKIDEAGFFKGTVPLQFGGLPEIESAVSVYGYPIGGERMSVTNGVISRIDFQLYTHSGVDAHLTIQTSAAINPGNSGGPVLQEGKVVGVAFQGYSGDVAQNVGYMIPVPVVQRFLKDISHGSYGRYMDLSISTFKLQNPAMRRALGLVDDDHGVMVSSVAKEGSSDGVLKQGDVLLEIDGHSIASDSFVDLDGEHVQMEEIVERKFKGDEVRFKLLRNKQQMEVTVKLDKAFPYLIQANTYDVSPRYVLFGGLLFQPLGHDFYEAFQPEDLRVRFFYDFYVSDQLYVDHPEVIILSTMLPDPINTYLGEFRNGIVDEINGVKIRTLKDVSEALHKTSQYYVIKVLGTGRPIVLESSAVEPARARILQRYNVSKEENLSE